MITMYVLTKWNRKFGDKALFVVQDKSTGKFCLYAPDRPDDKTWVNRDLSVLPEYKDWDDFEHTEVDVLENVSM